MTPDIIFLWVPLITFGIFAARYMRVRAWQMAAWYGALMLVVLGWHLLELPQAVTVSVILWILYAFVVPRLYAVTFGALLRRDFDKAFKSERWLRLVMPVPSLARQRRLMQAYGLIQTNQVEAGLDALEQIANGTGKDAASAAAQLHLIKGEYEQLVEIAAGPAGQADPSVRLMGIRGLAEIGRLSDAIEAYRLEANRFQAFTTPMDQAMTKLNLFTHAGDVEAAEQYLNGVLRILPDAERQLIAARAAYFADGDWTVFNATMERLRPNIGGAMTPRIEQWLAGGSQPRQTVSDEDREKLQALRQEQVNARAYYQTRVSKPLAALAFMGLNVLIFLLTTSFGGEINIESGVLQDAIFVYPYIAETGEWYRLLTATFLHLNYLHVGFNMLALALFGFAVEKRIGHGRFITIYLLSGIGSMVAAVINYEMSEATEPLLAMGASGSIFGILGAVLAMAILTYRRTKLFQARQDVTAILMIVAIQTVFDWTYLEGSSPLHLSGLISGFVITMLIAPRDSLEPAPPPPSGEAPSGPPNPPAPPAQDR
ncbi:MAG: rhomboid family intramembrane serine protease [Alphaproteobacteria bacterium]|nr:rhomboid family intramembrane serine protease [Alphaproteobacteria bacterium SS10]